MSILLISPQELALIALLCTLLNCFMLLAFLLPRWLCCSGFFSPEFVCWIFYLFLFILFWLVHLKYEFPSKYILINGDTFQICYIGFTFFIHWFFLLGWDLVSRNIRLFEVIFSLLNYLILRHYFQEYNLC